jgi:hypothetical protein
MSKVAKALQKFAEAAKCAHDFEYLGERKHDGVVAYKAIVAAREARKASP